MNNLGLVAAFVLMGLASAPEIRGQITGAASKHTVYVSDFDLDVIPAKPGQAAAASTAPAASTANKTTGQTASKEEDPIVVARRLRDLVSTNLVDALQKAGYPAQRLGRNQGRPASGVQIRGVFAEIDKENHWRRGVIRSGPDSGKLQLLVSVSNLARPEQALYEIARLPGNENKPGAVITLSSYVPLEQFEIGKDASEDVIKKTASRIVADVEKLLEANPAAVSQ